jgi:hypothetical protein
VRVLHHNFIIANTVAIGRRLRIPPAPWPERFGKKAPAEHSRHACLGIAEVSKVLNNFPGARGTKEGALDWLSKQALSSGRSREEVRGAYGR